jgi:hypothetical protein
MFVISVKNNQAARTGSYAVTLAEQKMEQLRGDVRVRHDRLAGHRHDDEHDVGQ